jgi:hypothetical protein
LRKLIALALIILIVSSVSLAASNSVPRHVDPNSAPEDPVYGQGLYLFYGSIVVALTGGNFSAAKQLLVHASFIHIPAEIADTVNTFNRLINTTSTMFTVISTQLKNASEYISTGRLAQARVSLQGAEANLRDANATLSQLFGAALTGIPSSPLQQTPQPLEGIYVSYNIEANHLLKVLTELSRLELPTVTLVPASRVIETGSNVTVTGRLLTPAGAPLVSREVTVYFENQVLGSASTGGTGAYSATFRTPYFYQRNASMFASFLPSGNDSLVYSSATSTPVFISVTFISPDVTFVSPKTVNAGQPLRVNGTLSYAGHHLAGYSVSLTGFTQSFKNETIRTKTLANGSFSLDLTTPTSLSRGTYPLTIYTGPNKTIGPAATSLRVFLLRIDPTITSKAPFVAFAGFPTTISGSVLANDSGLAGARVLNTSPAVNTVTGRDGIFSFTVTPAITTPNGGWSYTVGVYPSQSWISATRVTVSVFVINPLVLLFPATSVGFLVFAVRRRRSAPQVVPVEPKKEVSELQAEQARQPLEGLALTYSQAVDLVVKATSIALAPQMTAREYLHLIKDKLRGYGHFESITSALEVELYGGGAPSNMAGKAESELDALRSEIEA